MLEGPPFSRAAETETDRRPTIRRVKQLIAILSLALASVDKGIRDLMRRPLDAVPFFTGVSRRPDPQRFAS